MTAPAPGPSSRPSSRPHYTPPEGFSRTLTTFIATSVPLTVRVLLRGVTLPLLIGPSGNWEAQSGAPDFAFGAKIWDLQRDR